jgi:hypothetical protein
MIALVVCQSEHPFLEDRIFAIPKCQGDAQMLFAIAKAANSVFSPAIRAAGRVVVREIVPRVSIGAVVLAHGAPLALTYIRTPLAPGLLVPVCFIEALPLNVHLSRHVVISFAPYPRGL